MVSKKRKRKKYTLPKEKRVKPRRSIPFYALFANSGLKDLRQRIFRQKKDIVLDPLGPIKQARLRRGRKQKQRDRKQIQDEFLAQTYGS
ncbi:MAG TPA: hypothetical protein DCW74_14220 [Alteromonas australica]|uniref:Uncharacterized protein n=1 Tax=Alteromonas australica TaxID=589873 RepID=A0A350P6F8_9ALTE|nr:hypothetical protein [Alteromonas australica]